MLIIQRIKNKFVFNGTKRKIILNVVCCCRAELRWLYPTFELGNLAASDANFFFLYYNIAFGIERKSLPKFIFIFVDFVRTKKKNAMLCSVYELHFAYI